MTGKLARVWFHRRETGMDTTADRIFNEPKKLPEPLAQEVLDSIGYLELRHGLRDLPIEDLKVAQSLAMLHIWDNPGDEVWNDL